MTRRPTTPTAAARLPRNRLNHRGWVVAPLGACIAVILADPADAAKPGPGTVTTYTGVVTSSLLSTGQSNGGFGYDGDQTVQDSLVGEAVTERFYTKDAYGSSIYQLPYDSALHGVTDNPAVSSIVTVGGHQIDLVAVHTYETDGTAYRSALAGNDAFSEVYDLSSGESTTLDGYTMAYTYADVGSYVTAISPSPDYHSAMSYTVGPGDLTQGSVEFDSFDNTTGYFTAENFTFSVSSVTVSSSRADLSTDAFYYGVPEPATWALMLTGFGGAGAALRRRRSAPARASEGR
jgi:hypothetical protein